VVQDFYTQPRLLRILGKNDSNPMEMMINVRAADGVINDVTQGRYSMVVDETSLTDAFLDAQFNELITMMQQGLPIPPEFLIDASSIGRKEELRVALAQAAAAGVPPGGATPGGAPDGKGEAAPAPPQPGLPQGPAVMSSPPAPRLPQ